MFDSDIRTHRTTRDWLVSLFTQLGYL